MQVQMKYTVYKITNLLNGKIYIGIHKTDNLDDDYMGSGNNIKKAIKKYGVKNFKKEYLAVFDEPSDMFDLETKLVNEEFVKNKNNYNIVTGGVGSFDYVNEKYWTKEARQEHGKRYGSNAGSWTDKNKRLKVWACVPNEQRKEIGESLGNEFGGQNKLTELEINNRLNSIKDIDLTSYGWVKKVSIKLNLSHAQVKRFIDKFYTGIVYRRT